MENKSIYDYLIENRHNPDLADDDFILLLDMYVKFKNKKRLPHVIAPWLKGEEDWRYLIQAARNGEKLTGVKFVKEKSGMGLKEAKEWFDKNFESLSNSDI